MINLTTFKPNELIRLAIADMKKTIAQGSRINMDSWGENIGTPECSVCFAGSVMLQEGKKMGLNNDFSFDYDDVNANCYRALDNIRKGDFVTFCEYLDVIPPIPSNTFPFEYAQFSVKYERGNEEQFYQQMEWFAKLFD